MAKDKKVYQLNRRRLFVLEHMFDTIYDRIEPLPYDEYMSKVTYTDLESNKNFGSKLMHSFVRYNDIHGIHYMINEKEFPKGYSFSRLLSFNSEEKSSAENNTLTDNTIAKNLKPLVDDHKILVYGEYPTQRNVRLYYPNESIEGLDHLIDYLLKLKFDLYSDFDKRCRGIVHSRYASVVLNRQYVITKLREKGMKFELKVKFPDGTTVKGKVPYLGNYRKVFENSKPIEKFIEIATRTMNGLAEKINEGSYQDEFEKLIWINDHEVLELAVEKCKEALSNIDKINKAIKEKKSCRYVEDDVLTHLPMDKWFELDPYSVLRREALWEDAVISEEELDSIIPLMQAENSERKEFTAEEIKFIKDHYREEAEKQVLFILSSISFSFYAMAFFRRYSADAINKIQTGLPSDTENPFKGLENTPAYPDISKGIFGYDRWESQMLRCVLSDYITGLGRNNRSAPTLLAVGSIYDGKDKIPSLVSFRLDCKRIITIDGNLRNFFTGMDVMGRYSPMPLGMEIRIHGNRKGVPYLFDTVGEYIWGGKNPRPLIRDVLESIYSDGSSDYDVEKAVQDYTCDTLSRMKHCFPSNMLNRYE